MKFLLNLVRGITLSAGALLIMVAIFADPEFSTPSGVLKGLLIGLVLILVGAIASMIIRKFYSYKRVKFKSGHPGNTEWQEILDETHEFKDMDNPSDIFKF